MHVFVPSYLSVEECRNIIVQFGVREVTAVQVARVLGMMARTHSGLTDGISLQVSRMLGDYGDGRVLSAFTNIMCLAVYLGPWQRHLERWEGQE